MTKQYFIGVLVWMFVCFNAYMWMFIPMFFVVGLQWSAFIAVLFTPVIYLAVKDLK